MNYHIKILIPMISFCLSLQSMNIVQKGYQYIKNSAKQAFQKTADEYFIKALAKYDIREAAFWISLGASVETEASCTALQRAAMRNDLAIAEFLLKKGANPDKKDAFSLYQYPLECAVDCNSLAMVKLLLHYKADINKGFPLYNAAYQGNVEITMTLLAHGASTDDSSPLSVALYVVQKEEMTPSKYALYMKIIKALLYAGTNIHEKGSRAYWAPIELGDEYTNEMLKKRSQLHEFCTHEELAELNQMMEARRSALIKKQYIAHKKPLVKQLAHRQLTGRLS